MDQPFDRVPFMHWWKALNQVLEQHGMPDVDFAEARHWFWADEVNGVRREHKPGHVFSPVEAAQAIQWGCRS